MTATLVHTSSREVKAAAGMARVLAAGRVKAARQAQEAREAARTAHNLGVAQAVVADWRAAGAERVGFKIWDEDAKWRTTTSLEAAPAFMARLDCFDAWALDAQGAQVGETFGVM